MSTGKWRKLRSPKHDLILATMGNTPFTMAMLKAGLRKQGIIEAEQTLWVYLNTLVEHNMLTRSKEGKRTVYARVGGEPA